MFLRGPLYAMCQLPTHAPQQSEVNGLRKSIDLAVLFPGACVLPIEASRQTLNFSGSRRLGRPPRSFCTMRAAAESTITSMAIALADGLRAGFPDQRERYAKVLDPRSLCGLEIRTAPSAFGLSVRPMAPQGHRATANPGDNYQRR
jgi:hypothetical protein